MSRVPQADRPGDKRCFRGKVPCRALSQAQCLILRRELLDLRRLQHSFLQTPFLGVGTSQHPLSFLQNREGAALIYPWRYVTAAFHVHLTRIAAAVRRLQLQRVSDGSLIDAGCARGRGGNILMSSKERAKLQSRNLCIAIAVFARLPGESGPPDRQLALPQRRLCDCEDLCHLASSFPFFLPLSTLGPLVYLP